MANEEQKRRTSKQEAQKRSKRPSKRIEEEQKRDKHQIKPKRSPRSGEQSPKYLTRIENQTCPFGHGGGDPVLVRQPLAGPSNTSNAALIV